MLFKMVPPGDPTPAPSDLAAICSRYTEVGLTAKESKLRPYSETQEGLGYQLSKNVWACTAAKYESIAGATRDLLARGWAFPREVERICGQFTNVFLLHRTSLSVFSCVYIFGRRMGDRCAKLWPVAARELRLALAILPMVVADVSRPVSPTLIQVDACPKGGAVVYTKSVRHGDLQREVRRPRPKFADVKFVDHSVEGAPPRPVVAGSMRSLFDSPLDPGVWEVALRRSFSSGGHINERELQMIVDAVRWFSRTAGNCHSRLVVESDSLVAVCTVRKGRSSKPGLLKHCRRLAALTLALGIVVELRWIPTGRNMADQPSRGSRVPGPCLG